MVLIKGFDAGEFGAIDGGKAVVLLSDRRVDGMRGGKQGLGLEA